MSDGLQEQYRREALDEDIAKLEAEMFGPPDGTSGTAEQEKPVLGDDQVASPDQSTEPTVTSTEDPFETVTADKDTQPQSGELAKLRKEYAELEHRANRYKGKTDQTIYTLRGEVARLNKLVSTQQRANVDLQAMLDEQSVKLDEESKDILGEEAAKIIEGLKSEVAELKRSASVDTSQYDNAASELESENANDFMDNLNRLVPDLDAMNKDAGFNEWLRQDDDYGIQRLATLRGDQGRGDYVRVSQFFDEYRSLKATLESVKDPEKFADSTDAYAGPTGTQSGDSVQRVEGKDDGTIKQSEINKYEQDVAAGKYKYDSSFPEAMEARIFKASVDGKIIHDVAPTRTFKVR